MITIKEFRITGVETVNADLQKEIGKICRKLPEALMQVGAHLEDSLRNHIVHDVYMEYPPAEYKRRVAHPEAGRSLVNPDYMEYKVEAHSPTAPRLFFSYLPTGEYLTNEELHSRDYDDLIEWIEKGVKAGRKKAGRKKSGRKKAGTEETPLQNTAGYSIPPRPFWHNFLEEELANGGVMYPFIDAMRPEYEVINTPGTLTLDGGLPIDWEPEVPIPGSYVSKNDDADYGWSGDFDDETLPF